MFSGIQEILLIVAILLAIFFIPRMTARRPRQAPKPVRPMRRLFRLSVRWRMALVASLLWPMGAAVYFKPWQASPEPFLYFGLGPVLIGWSISWVIAGIGFRKKN